MVKSKRQCAKFASQFSLYLAGDLAPKQVEAWREHRGDCGPCKQRFEQAMEQTSLVTRPLRLAQEASEKRERRAKHRRLALAGALLRVGAPRRLGSWHRAKTLVLPALLVFLFTRVSNNQQPKAQVWANQGSLLLDGQPVDGELSPRTVDRGSWCETGPNSLASLVWPSGRAELGSSTLAAVEDGRSSRVRLEHGVLHLQGTGQVTTPSGVVEVSSGACLVRHDGAGLEVEEVSGKVRRIDARGETWLSDSPGSVSVR